MARVRRSHPAVPSHHSNCSTRLPAKIIARSSSPAMAAAWSKATTLICGVSCGKKSSLYLGTQAFTKVYKNPKGIPSKQTITGTVETNGLSIVLPDPVVPYAHSIFEQDQHWHLAPNACLLIADGHTSGRFAHNEHFAYKKYTSNITITTPDRPLLIERYQSEPAISSPTQVGAFGDYNTTLSVFVAGTPTEPKFAHLITSLSNQLTPLLQPSDHPPLLLSFSSPKPELFVARALARDVESLNPFYAAISNAIAHPAILGSDPLARKY